MTEQSNHTTPNSISNESAPSPVGGGPAGGPPPRPAAPAPPFDRWFAAHAGRREGPMDRATLLARVLKGDFAPDDLCWCKEMKEWAPIRTVAELVGGPERKAPEPVPTAGPAPTAPPPRPMAPPSPPPPPRPAAAPPRPVAPPLPPPPRPVAGGEKFGYDTLLGAMDIAFDLRKMGFVCIMTIITAVGLLLINWLTSLVAKGGGNAAAVASAIGSLLAVIYLAACAGITAGGMGRMVNIEMTQNRRSGMGEAWAFIARRIGGLCAVLLVFFLAMAIILAVINGGAMGISRIPAIGSVLGGLLTIPLFLFNALGLFILMNLSMLPLIMAVEDCGAFQSFGRLVTLLPQRFGRLLSYEIAMATIVVPLLLIVMGLFVVSSGITLSVTGGEKPALVNSLFRSGDPFGGGSAFQGMNFGGFGRGEVKKSVGESLGSFLTQLSMGILVALFVAFLVSYSYTCFTIIYRTIRR